MDTRTPEQRSRIMRAVRQKHTAPELAVRRALHALGYRFRLHSKSLTGKPDLVFPARRKVIFVHGCFWHGHACPKGKLPKSRTDYWEPKIAANILRDEHNVNMLEEAGWESMTVWQCETRKMNELVARIGRFLETDSKRDPNRSEEVS